MDPVSALSLAASIIAVIQLTGALMKPATSSLGPSENDEKELKRLQTTLVGFQVAYNNLEHYLKSNPGIAEALVIAIQQPIQNCNMILSELRLRLSNMTFVRKHIIGKKWDKEFKHFVKRLDDARQLFDVILQGDQSQRLIEISQFMTEKSKDIETLDQRFSEIHSTVQTHLQKLELQAHQNKSELRSILESSQNKIENEEQRRLKEHIFRWLVVVDPESNHESALASHQPGTGDWFIKGQSYLNWLTKPKSFFWLNGKAGCGKTILSSTIIESTITYCNENEGCAMAYFYLSFTDAEKQKCSNMVRSLLVQLVSQIDITPKCLVSLHAAYQNSKPPIKETINCIQALLNEMPFGHVYIIVDAIDEIPDASGRQEACEILDKLSRNAKAHVLATSRRERDTTEYMTECSSLLDISIQNPEVDRDIQIYIREELQNEKKLMKWSAIHSEIEDSLSREANGMFRWAACQLDALKNCLSVNAVRKALKSLPKTLDETYERILLAIDEDNRDVAIEALRWLCFSERLLEIQELAEAAVFTTKAQILSDEFSLEISFDEDDRIQDPVDILEILSGLVVCVPYISKDIRNDHGTSRFYIILAHFSIKEFLVSNRLKNEIRCFSTDEHQAQETLATKCLYYILYSQPFIEFYQDPKTSQLPKPNNIISHPSSPMFSYDYDNWLKHARKVDHESELDSLIALFLQVDLRLRECMLLELNHDRYITPPLMPIYLISALGLYWCCKALVETGVDVNIQEGYFGSALQVASRRGYERIVSMLINNGADVNIQGGFYGNALQAASWAGNECIVLLLINNGADVNLQGGYFGNSLQIVSRKDVNIQGAFYGNALQAAAWEGHERIALLLLDNGANVDFPEGFYGNALHIASRKGNKQIASILINNGADVNSTGPEGTHLEAAMQYGCLQVAVMLLEHGATLSPYCCIGGTGAEEAFARKDFKKFVEIEMDAMGIPNSHCK